MGAIKAIDLQILVSFLGLCLSLWGWYDAVLDREDNIRKHRNGSTGLASRIRFQRERMKILLHLLFIVTSVYVRAWLEDRMATGLYPMPEISPEVNILYIRTFTMTLSSLVLAYDTFRDRMNRWEMNKIVQAEWRYRQRRDKRASDR